MNSGEIDRFPVKDLPSRYDNLARSAVYKRLEALGIKAYKVGNKGFVTGVQLRQLDALHAFIQQGGNTAEFLERQGLPDNRGGNSGGSPPDISAGLSTGPSDIMQVMAAIASQMGPRTPERDRFAYFKTLEEAAKGGWLLRTSELADLLDLPESEIRQYGDRFTDAGFVFTKAGYRSRGEVAWKVSKP